MISYAYDALNPAAASRPRVSPRAPGSPDAPPSPDVPDAGDAGDERSLGFLLHEVGRLFRRDLDRRFKALAPTQAQWRALGYLRRHEGINQVGLAELLEVRPITLARLVDRLEEAGWVERRADPHDRRMCRLYLTEAAGPVIERMRSLAEETKAVALRGVSARAREELLDTLAAIKANLAAAEAEQGSAEREEIGARAAKV